MTGMARHPLAFQSVCKSSLPLSRAETAELQSLGGGLVHPPGLFNIDYILVENQCDKADKAGKVEAPTQSQDPSTTMMGEESLEVVISSAMTVLVRNVIASIGLS